FRSYGSVVGWAKPTGPAGACHRAGQRPDPVGRPDDGLRVPTAAPLVGTAREERTFAHPTSDSGRSKSALGARNIMSWAQDRIGRMLARYLETPATGYEPFTPSDPDALARSLQPGDVLLVEGNNHIAGVIKYLTQSTWSHAALYVGPVLDKFAGNEPHVLIEAEIGQGVIPAPLSKHVKFHTRVCRPVGLTAEDLDKVCRYAIDRIGFDYDLKNIIDLMRYLMPAADPAAWAPAHDGAWLGRPHADHLLGPDCPGLRIRAIPDPAAGDPDGEPAGAPRHPGNSPFLAIRPARFRHFAVFR